MTAKSGRKSGRSRGLFAKGHDPRRGRGPKRGATNAGRPPDEFRAALQALASWDEVLVTLERILRDPDHPQFMRALEYCADRGYGKPPQQVDLVAEERQHETGEVVMGRVMSQVGRLMLTASTAQRAMVLRQLQEAEVLMDSTDDLPPGRPVDNETATGGTVP